MARVAARAPARVGPARAAVARPEHGPRRLPEATSGNTPGHLNHWSKRGVRRAAVAARRGRRGALAVPVDDAARRRDVAVASHAERRACARRTDAARLRARRADPLGRHRRRPASSRSRTSRSPSHALSEVDYKGISLLWSVMFVIISVIYRPIEQLLSRTIADAPGARATRRHPLRVAAHDPGELRASLFLVVALAFTRADRGRRLRRLGGAVLGARGRACSPTRRATSPAAGSPATSASGSTAGSCCWSRVSRCLFALAVALGIASRPDRGRAGHRGGAARLAGRRAVGAQRARPAPRASDRGARRRCASPARASPVAVLAIMVAEQTLLNGPVLTADVDRDRRRARRLRVQRAADRARAAAALPGDPDLAPPPPRRPGGDRRAAPTSTARSGSRSLAIAAFAGAVALGLGLIGPWAMGVLFGGDFDYGRVGLALVGARDGLPPDRGHAQPGGAGARPRRRWRPRPGWLAAAVFLLLAATVAARRPGARASRSATARRPRCWPWRCGSSTVLPHLCLERAERPGAACR